MDKCMDKMAVEFGRDYKDYKDYMDCKGYMGYTDCMD